MKRLFLLCFFVLGITTSLVAATETVDGIEWDYTVSNGKASIGTGSYNDPAIPTSTSGAITIPASLDGYPVTSIEDWAFYDCGGLTSVTIPSSVTSIGHSAFSGCSGLTSVTIPPSVTSIGMDAFNGCSGLTSVTIPEGVTSIGDSAFSGCNGLTSVTIPSSVTEIRYLAFSGCSGLMAVYISDLAAWCKISFESLEGFPANPLFYAHNLYLNGERVTDLTIPEGVTSIGMDAFNGCSGLTSVTIPSSVTSIGDSAFSGCSGLTSITIPDGVTSIVYRAFSGCSGLTSITIPEGVTSIEDWAFYDCGGLTSVTIPSSVTSIGNGAFEGVAPEALTAPWLPDGMAENNLKTLAIPEGVTSIGDSAFSGCSGLTSVMIPSSVTSIASSAFSNIAPSTLVSPFAATTGGMLTKNLVSVTYLDGIRVISDDAFNGVTSLTSIVLPRTVTTIGARAFKNCNALSVIEMSDSVTSIGNEAFEGCTALTSIRIPSNVYRIQPWTFYNCSSLTSVTIPESMVVIEGYAFYNCNSLSSVTFEGAPPSGADTFPNATGYYSSQYAAEWEAVIADGTWNNLTMQVYDEPTEHTPPDWTVGNYQNNMVLYAQVKDITTGVFIETAGSLLAAFDSNGICRGKVEAIDIGLEAKVYQLTICSDKTSGETLTLKIWDAATGETTTLNETIPFVSDSEVGILWEPVLYEIGLKALELTLNPGWNWCSSNVVIPNGVSLTDFFTGWTPQNGDQIKAATTTATYYNGAWRPTDFVIEPGKMYLIKNSADTTITTTVMGLPVNRQTTIDVATGWNWIGYTGAAPIAVANAFVDNSMFANGDVLKANATSATFYNGAWRGSLTLTPGQGYKLKVASPATIQYSTDSETVAPAPMQLMTASMVPDWQVDNYQYNMVVYAAVQDVNETTFDAEGCVLGAFDGNGICRGKVEAIDVGIGVKVYQLTVCSDDATESGLILKLWDAATSTVYDVNGMIDFKSDTEIGQLWEPMTYTTVATEVKYPVSVAVIGEGSVAGEASYAAGEEVVLTAIADEGNLFCGWSTTPVTMTAAYTFTMPEEAVTLTAYFAPADAVEAYVSGKELVTADEVDAKIQDYIVVNQLMSKDAAKQALLAADEVFTADEMKEMAFGAPVMEVKDDVIEIAISLQTAETLNAWEALALQGATLEIDATKGQVRVKVPKGNKSAAFYKFVVPTEQ